MGNELFGERKHNESLSHPTLQRFGKPFSRLWILVSKSSRTLGGKQIPSSLVLKLMECRLSSPLTGSMPDYIGRKFDDIEE